MFPNLIKAFVATTLLGGTGSIGKITSGVIGDMAKSFLDPNQSGSTGQATNIQGAIEPSVFTFKDDVMADDIKVVDAIDLNSTVKSTQTASNAFPLGTKLEEVVKDAAYRRFMENAHTNNAMQTVSNFRGLSEVSQKSETAISINNPTLIT